METAQKQTNPNSVWVAVRRRCAKMLALVALFLFAVSVSAVSGAFSYTRGRAYAATSGTLNFQARLLSNTGSLVADGSYNIQFNLYTQQAPGGSTQWTESNIVSAAQGVTVKNGYLSVSLGSITAFPSTISWDQDQYLGMTVRGTGSCAFGACTPADAEMTPRFKLTAVPYAFRAAKLMDSTNTNAFTADDLIQKTPATPQVISSALAAIRLNQTSSGGLLQLQNTGVDKFTVDNLGNTVTAGTTTLNGTQLTNTGSTLNTAVALGNFVANGPIGTAAATVDSKTSFTIGQTAAGVSLTLPSPSTSIGGRVIYVANTGSVSVVVNGSNMLPASTVTFLWNGSAWIASSSGAPGVNVIGTIDTQAKSSNGAVISGTSLVLQTADASSAGLVSATAQTFAGNKTFNGQIIGAAGLSVDGAAVSLNVTGSALTSIGNGTGALTLTGNSSSTFVINGATVDATEFVRLDGKDASLVDSNDAVTTAITGTGALTAGSIGGSFGNISIGTNVFTGNGSGLTTLSGTSISSGTVSNSYLTGSGTLTVTAGTGLSGGGSVALGGSTSLSVSYGSAAGTAVQGNTSLVCASGSGNLTGGGNTITIGSGGTCGAISTNNAVSFSTSVTSPLFTGAGAVTLSSGAAADLTLDSASNIVVLSDATLRRTAVGTTALQLNDTANTTFSITNTDGTAVAGLNVEGAIAAASLSGDGSGLTNLSATNLAGTINDARLSSNVVLLTGTQTFSGLKTFGAGLTVTTGQNFTVNSDIFTDLTGTGLINTANALSVAYGSTAGTTAQGNTTFTCPTGTGNLTGGGTSITIGAGGTCGAISTNNAVSFSTSVTTPTLTSTAGLTISSGGSSALTLDSASNTIIIASNDTTLQRTAAGSYTIDLADAGTTTLSLSNNTAGVANLDLVDGGLLTAGTSRLTNSGTLQNITGLTISSGGASVTGAATFISDVALNGNTTIGDATTDRLTVNAQILGANGLVFQGATDNAFATTFAITNPTANNTINVPDASGTITLIGTINAQVDTSTNSSIFINKTGASGNILTLQKNGTSVFTVGNDGSTSISSTSTAALTITNAGGTTDFFTVDTSGSLVRVGSATPDATATVFIADTKNTAGDPSGGAATDGAQYYNSFWAVYRCYRDGRWETCGTTPIDRGMQLNDEFISGGTATGTIGGLNWSLSTISNASTLTYNNATAPAISADHSGILRITTAGTANRGSTVSLNQTSGTNSTTMAANQNYKYSVAPGATITSMVMRVGAHNETTAVTAPTIGVWLEYNQAVSAFWQYCYGTGGVPTCVATTNTVIASSFDSLEIRIISLGAGTSAVDYYVAGVKYSVTGATISTGLMSPALTCYTTSGTAKDCNIDYFQMTYVSTARR